MAGSAKWLALLAFAGVSAANGARAEECSSDDDCPTSTRCEWGTSDDVGSSDGIAAPCAPDTECDMDPLPSSGSCQPLPEGECEVDGDCADGRACIKATWTSDCPAPAPEPGDEGKDAIAPPEECSGEEVTARYGSCETPRVECQSDADCANGLTCILSGSSSGSSGGGADPVEGAPLPPDGEEERPGDIIAEPETTGYCGWLPQDCDENTPCAAGFACVETASSGTCSSAGAPPCPSGSECVTDPAEPDCTYEVERICLPEEAPCDDDADCGEGWECVEFTSDGTYPEAPEFWDASGDVKSCVPSGLATEIENDGPGFGGGEGTVDTGTERPIDDNGGQVDVDGAKSSSGCSVGTRGGSFGALSGLVIAGLALVRRRRTRR